MKATQRRGIAAFTLIEMMAVVTIIVILAGLVVGGMGFVQERQSKEKAKVQIALLSRALEEYKLDMGTYPLTDNKPTPTGTGGTGTSTDLYNVLFYEGYDYVVKNSPATWVKTVGSNTSFPKSSKIYCADLNPVSSNQGWVTKATAVPTTSKILDPWGNEYCYRTATPLTGTTPNAATMNPDFDLWSMGKDGKTNPATPSDKVNLDDIKNF